MLFSLLFNERFIVLKCRTERQLTKFKYLKKRLTLTPKQTVSSVRIYATLLFLVLILTGYFRGWGSTFSFLPVPLAYAAYVITVSKRKHQGAVLDRPGFAALVFKGIHNSRFPLSRHFDTALIYFCLRHIFQFKVKCKYFRTCTRTVDIVISQRKRPV